MTSRRNQVLIIDGDDTLWENNVYFEAAIEAFIDYLGHSTMSRAQVRAALDEVELMNVRKHGYGSAAFTANLRQCYEDLAERKVGKDDIEHVVALGQRIAEQPMTLIAGVPETLAYLRQRHTLILFTKGHREEQRLKVERSGLEETFHHTVITHEKDPDAYRGLVWTYGLEAGRTWMVGNSPKSDINASLAAGLNAVFIPHERTWSLEKQDLAEANGRLLILKAFPDLREHF
ncbi:MAG TPA: HAD family hydrolase [Candidatus Limnocylindrales bacterium]|nr:HAD family hydrolase [Candidatus Limnocylindrales bacterium]